MLRVAKFFLGCIMLLILAAVLSVACRTLGPVIWSGEVPLPALETLEDPNFGPYPTAPAVIPPTSIPTLAPTAAPTLAPATVPPTAVPPTAVPVQSAEITEAIRNGRARMGYLIKKGTFADFSEFVALADADPAKVEAYENYTPTEDLYLYCSHYDNTDAWSATAIVEGWTGVWYAEVGEQVPTNVSCGGLPVSLFR